MAETVLAQACENESNNAKRMRMGLEPLPAHSVTILLYTVSFILSSDFSELPLGVEDLRLWAVADPGGVHGVRTPAL